MTDRLEDINNFLLLSDRLATAGQPTIEQYPALTAADYRLVINLALNNSLNALANEAVLAANLGLEYIQIPVEWDTPTLADFQEFMRVMTTRTDRKIFVHCAANKRVSVFMYLYRQICVGVDEATARLDLAKIWTPNALWQQFIESIAIEYELPLR
jgi:protein tyrosine phosphatase (PTP) superfamily phosphohydrolase (DUF442 family)